MRGSFGLGWYLRARLQRRLFAWFGFSIIFTTFVVMGVVRMMDGAVQGWRLALVVAIAVGMLWGASARMAHRLARPLAELARVARELGAGNLSARAQLRWYAHGEVGVLGEVLNDMARRIERQVADQRELLAAVSHELRTPLGRMRVLTEIVRQNGADAKTLDDLDREVMEIDALVGNLLASSRMDFAAVSPRKLEPREVALRALERAGQDGALLVVEGAPGQFEADPTLVARALANLLDNARIHGGGLSALRVVGRDARVAFEAEDAGAGFPPGEEAQAFDAFRKRPRGERPSGLGLGLALVKRIAEAHQGRVYAHNRAEGGARVGFEIPARPS